MSKAAILMSKAVNCVARGGGIAKLVSCPTAVRFTCANGYVMQIETGSSQASEFFFGCLYNEHYWVGHDGWDQYQKELEEEKEQGGN